MVYQEIVEEIQDEIRDLEEERSDLERKIQVNNEPGLMERLEEVNEDISVLKDELKGYENGDLVI